MGRFPEHHCDGVCCESVRSIGVLKMCFDGDEIYLYHVPNVLLLFKFTTVSRCIVIDVQFASAVQCAQKKSREENGAASSLNTISQ